MAKCWNCLYYFEQAPRTCENCGVSHPDSRPAIISVIDKLPTKYDSCLVCILLAIPWSVCLIKLAYRTFPPGATWTILTACDIYFSLLFAGLLAPITAFALNAISKYLKAIRPKFIHEHERGLTQLELKTSKQLSKRQERLKHLLTIIQRERRDGSLIKDDNKDNIAYRNDNIVPGHIDKIKGLVSILIRVDVKRWINDCEKLCENTQLCSQDELNERYEMLLAKAKQLELIKQRWLEYIYLQIMPVERKVMPQNQMQPQNLQGLREIDALVFQEAIEIFETLKFDLHKTQESLLMRSTTMLEDCSEQLGESLTTNTTILKRIYELEISKNLEEEYQRIVGEKRVTEDTARGYLEA